MTSTHDVLTEQNFLLYAAANYINIQCFSTEEFYDDLKRFKYLKRLFNQYSQSRELKERLIINHMIVLGNVFSIEALVRMLFFKLKGFERELKPFLILMNFLPPIVPNIDGININTDEITMDVDIVEKLRKIGK